MAADQERADRIRALKQARPDLTWRRIAEHVGVTERSATDWQTKGGMEYANAKKLAELFEVDVDYIWRGSPASDTPDLSRPDIALTEILDDIKAQLAEQTQVLNDVKQLLLDVQDATATQAAAAVQMQAATDLLNTLQPLEPVQEPAESQPKAG